MLAEFPQNWALQRFPVAKWLAGNLVIWYVASLDELAERKYQNEF